MKHSQQLHIFVIIVLQQQFKKRHRRTIWGLDKGESDIGHLKAFSCLCYVYVATDKWEKFDAKASKCISW